jgi:hypothetical protein
MQVNMMVDADAEYATLTVISADNITTKMYLGGFKCNLDDIHLSKITFEEFLVKLRAGEDSVYMWMDCNGCSCFRLDNNMFSVYCEKVLAGGEITMPLTTHLIDELSKLSGCMFSNF